jgi:hypothetical protein
MGEAQGKKVAATALRPQTIEAQPVFGQIEHHRGPVRRVLKRNLGRKVG